MSQTVQTTDLARSLAQSLRQTFTLYQRTHLAHWNVKGPYFPQLHVLFEGQYNELWAALDVLAERVRSYGTDVPADALSAGPADLPSDALVTVRTLAAEHRALSTHFATLEKTAQDQDDPATADLATERIRAHDQMAWMLEATSA